MSVERAIPVETVMDSVFDPGALEWQVTASSKDKTLNFGTWRVDDNTGLVAPGNAIAASIDSPTIICGVPVAHLSGAPTPPHILLPEPPPIVEPEALVQTANQAELLVWVSVYNCYDHFPELTSFTGLQDESGNWVVEGRSPITQYGLWRVNATTGQPIALDLLAREAVTACNARTDAAFPVVATIQQAALRVWSATYDCFIPSPGFDTFTVRMDSPQRWLVEGREIVTIEVEVQRVVSGTTETFTEERTSTVFYGLWMVDSSSGEITAWDDLAKSTAVRSCFKDPFG